MSAQSERIYYKAMRLEIDPYDRSYILCNIGPIHSRNGEHTKALEYYFRVLERNPKALEYYFQVRNPFLRQALIQFKLVEFKPNML